MDPNTRACIACVVGAAAAGLHSPGAVYDYARSKFVTIGGVVNGNQVNLFDYERRCHFAGSRSLNSFSLYDYGGRAHVSISMTGASFQGYHYASRAHFSGTSNSSTVVLYDYSESKHFHFETS